MVRVESRGLDDHAAAWADGWRVSLPPRLEKLVTGDIDSSGRIALADLARHVVDEDGDYVRSFRLFAARQPSSSRLPFSYQRIPSWARTFMGDAIGRIGRRRLNRAGAFPMWPLDLSADILHDLARPTATRANGITQVLLTHDIDSPEGLRNLVERFLPIEEAAGARSANYVVPCAWPLDDALLREISDRGHEIGVHGYDHSNRTPFVDAGECRRRLDGGLERLGEYSPRGYRAPSLLRTPSLLAGVSGKYLYDSSVPTSGGLFPIPGNGCATARLFEVRDGLIEIPLSLPRDGSLRFLGYGPKEILALWIEVAETIKRSPGSTICLLTHCENRFTGGSR